MVTAEKAGQSDMQRPLAIWPLLMLLLLLGAGGLYGGIAMLIILPALTPSVRRFYAI
jgi:hypothetical protein